MFGRSNEGRRGPSPLHFNRPWLPFAAHAPVVGPGKNEHTVSVERLDSSDGPGTEADQEKGTYTPGILHDDTWRPGFRTRFPWLGATALMFILCASIGSILVLKFSNNVPQSKWPGWISPNVVLAGLNNAANIAITIAVAEGVAIAWWRKAMQGATVKELHHSWAFSTNLSVILFKYKYFNAVALAAMTTKFAVIDGMLYQKATSVQIETGPPQPFNSSYSAFVGFPATGQLNADGNATAVMSFEFSMDVMNWLASNSGFISGISFDNCEGFCYANMTAPGFAIDCNETQTDVDYGKNAISAFNTSLTNSSALSDESAWTDIPIFAVDFTQRWPDQYRDYARLTMDTLSYTPLIGEASKSHGSCPSLLRKRHCELRPSLIRYPLYIQNLQSSNSQVNNQLSQTGDGVFFQGDNNYYSGQPQIGGFDILKPIGAIEIQEPNGYTALGGFQMALEASLGGGVSMTYVGKNGWQVQQTGTLAAVVEGSNVEAGFCDYNFPDPMYQIISQLNILTFIAMTDVNLDSQPQAPQFVDQGVSGDQLKIENFYISNDRYVYGALGSTLFCILCILPAYWGFWELGRDVSLGPFEIANAFRAPVFEPVQGGAGHVRQVLKAVGEQKVQYGQTDDAKKLAFH